MSDLNFKIGADMKQFRTAMGSIDHSLRKLSGGFGALGGAIGAAFAVDIIQQFVSESLDLATQMEGVEAAFNRLNDRQLLDNLREATAGTVDDLKLMQTAVKAENFRIPMDTLAKGLEFAQRRAQATGESVDYMVDSFVTGLGRESVKILDNLGISTIELNAKTKELGSMAAAVGVIMDEEFEKVGERVTTTSMKVDQQRAALTNLKTEIGERLMPVYSAFLDSTISGLTTINLLMDQDSTTRERALIALKSYLKFSGSQNVVLMKTADVLTQVATAKRKIAEEEERNKPTLEDFRRAEQEYAQEQKENADKTKKALEDYFEKVEKGIPKIQRLGYEIREAFNPGEDTTGKLANQLGFAEVDTELEELEETTENFGDTFDHSFRNTIDTFRVFRDEFMMVGEVLRMSFEAAFAPLEEGETRLGNFREVFVKQLQMMAAQLLATAAAALILATILSVAFGGANMAGKTMFGKSGMGFGDLFGGLFGEMGGGFGFNGAGMDGNGGGIEIFGKLLGSDILLSGERAGRNRNRLSGIGG